MSFSLRHYRPYVTLARVKYYYNDTHYIYICILGIICRYLRLITITRIRLEGKLRVCLARRFGQTDRFSHGINKDAKGRRENREKQRRRYTRHIFRRLDARGSNVKQK